MFLRFLSVDPMSDSRPNLSPYNYCQWMPVVSIDPDGALDDEWDYDINTGNMTWVSSKGGSETQYVNVKNGDKQLGQTSVSGNQVFVYKLRDNVLVTNTDRNFNDEQYNCNSHYEYTPYEFKLRDSYLSDDTPISRTIQSLERDGKAVPLSYSEEEKKYGYTVMRLKMMMSAIDQTWDLLPTPSIETSREIGFKGKTTLSMKGLGSDGGLMGHSGAKALTGSNSWNMFLKANKGMFTGQGWQKRAAAVYYKSKFYKP